MPSQLKNYTGSPHKKFKKQLNGFKKHTQKAANMEIKINKISATDLPISDTPEFILEQLNSTGYVVISNYTSDTANIKKCTHLIKDISSMIGVPFPHNGKDSIVWDIKSNASVKAGAITTYSEHSHEAELHTDSQYSFYPEDYFALLTLKPATCGGGQSLLLSLKDILNELREVDGGIEAERILRKKDFPFIVPNVFKQTNGDEMEFNFGSILQDNEIRFRVDTFEKAIKLRPDFHNDEQWQAFIILKNIILNSPSILKFHLNAGDLVIINNKTMLHGRTSFTDQNRHLLRVRMNKFEHAAISMKSVSELSMNRLAQATG